MKSPKILLQRFVSDKNGNVVIAQAPNVPLLVWLVTFLFAHLLSGGASTLLSLLSKIALVVWASWELLDGDSPFRRTLGFAVLAFQILSVILW